MVTCLHARDHARMYMKELEEGTPRQRLSPEEETAVALATGRPAREPRPDGLAPAEPAEVRRRRRARGGPRAHDRRVPGGAPARGAADA